MQNNCPACYSLSQDRKLFNTTVRRGAILTPKCTKNCLGAGPTEGAYRALPDPLARFKGTGRREREDRRSNGKAKKGEQERERERREGR